MVTDDINSDAFVLEIGGRTVRPGERIGPYLYEKPIGKGGMATVVLARNASDQQVALKILKANRFKTGLSRFKREWRALCRIHHPNIIRVEEYGDVLNHPYIVMEYVEGTDLHQTIRAFKYLDNPEDRWRRCEDILVDTCRALAHVHQRGLVHRDLKPSNILIDGAGRAKLTDFGIVKDLDPDANDAMVSRTLVGTWAYASPEQISGDTVDHRSDLYSLGIILFAMLTGCRPFDEKDMKGYLDAHRNKKPPRPRQLDRRVPKILDEICTRLLEKQPKDRFQSAREVLYRLEQIEEESGPNLAGDWKPALVGRSPELEVINDAVDRLTRREGGMLVIEGAEGTGRTRLLETAAERATSIGIPTHRLNAGTGAAELFGLISFCREVMEALGDRTPKSLADQVADWSAGQARGGDAVFRLMDALRPAVVQLCGDGPRILLYDDFHKLPRRGLELVANLVRSTVAIGEPVLLVATVRSGQHEPALESILHGDELGISPSRIRLEPLTEAAVQNLVKLMLGESNRARALAQRLHHETEGNPLFVTQFLSALFQQGMITQGLRGLELSADTEEIAKGHLEIPAGVRQVVRGRLQDLGEDQVGLLRVLAVAGQALDLDITLEVLDQDEDEVMDVVDGLIARGLLVERRLGETVLHDVSHRLMGDVVYRDLSPEQRSDLHRRMAEALERRVNVSPGAVEMVGDHYRLAGDAGRAFRHLVAAARRMLARSLPSETMDVAMRAAASEELARAELPPAEMAALRLDLLDVRAQVLYVRGEWAECQKLLEALVRVAEEVKDQRAEVAGRALLGITLRRLGNVDAGRAEASRSLEQARALRKRELVARALYSVALNAWDDGKPKDVEKYASEGLVLTSGDTRSDVRGEMLLALAIAQASQGRIALASKNMEEAVEIFARLGIKHTRCLAMCNLAEMLVWQGRLVDARNRAEQALELANEISYRMGQAMAQRVRGESNFELGLRSLALRDLNKALETAASLGMSDEQIAARYCLARLAAQTGNTVAAEAHLAIARGLAERSDPERYFPAIQALVAWCCALNGELADAERMLDNAERGLDKLPVPRRTQVMIAAGRARAALSQTDQAQRMVLNAISLARSRGFRLLELEGRLLLSRLADDHATATAWKAEAISLARTFDAELSPELAASFWARPELEHLQ